MTFLPIDAYKKHRKSNPEETLGHVLTAFAALSPHVDAGYIFELTCRKFGTISMRDVELLARGLTQGYLAGRPNVSITDRKRNLPRPPE